MSLQPVLLTPEYREHIWGGARLRPGRTTAEAWVVYEKDRIASGPFAGRTLADLAAEQGLELLGSRVMSRTGARFPLLVKLLDCAQWLSIQVHPNDEQAARLEGPGLFGKTEAWHVLDAAPEARLIAGVRPGASAEALAQAIRSGAILDWAPYVPAQTGDTILIRPGTIHALGPGLMIYEVQQTSDITYRVFDWNRPQTAGRVLHIEKSLAVADPAATVEPKHLPVTQDGERRVLTECRYFSLEMIAAESRQVELDTRGETFHALTVIEGQARIECGSGPVTLNRFESAVIPAALGCYRIQSPGTLRVLKAEVPAVEA
jgi:mannose-6-phosphate isomerase